MCRRARRERADKATPEDVATSAPPIVSPVKRGSPRRTITNYRRAQPSRSGPADQRRRCRTPSSATVPPAAFRPALHLLAIRRYASLPDLRCLRDGRQIRMICARSDDQRIDRGPGGRSSWPTPTRVVPLAGDEGCGASARSWPGPPGRPPATRSRPSTPRRPSGSSGSGALLWLGLADEPGADCRGLARSVRSYLWRCW